MGMRKIAALLAGVTLIALSRCASAPVVTNDNTEYGIKYAKIIQRLLVNNIDG